MGSCGRGWVSGDLLRQRPCTTPAAALAAPQLHTRPLRDLDEGRIPRRTWQDVPITE